MVILFLMLQQPPVHEYLAARQAYTANPKSEERLVALVSILYKNDQNERAIEFLRPFVRTNPNAARAKLFLALGYAREEKYEQARALAATVTSALPRDYYAQHVLGLSLFGLNRFDEAKTRFKRALQLKPDFADSYFQLGLIYARKPETLEQARTSFQRALEAGYKNSEIHKNLGLISIKLGRLDDAIEHLKTALSIDPNLTEIYFLLADAFRKSGSPDKAAEAMQYFQSLNASATEKKQRELKSQGLYQEGMNLLAKDDLGKAYSTFKSAAETLPQLDTAHYRMAQIEYLRGDNQHALQSIRRALELNPFEPEYYFVLARCLEDSDVPAAIEAAKKAVSLNPGVADFQNLLKALNEKKRDR